MVGDRPEPHGHDLLPGFTLTAQPLLGLHNVSENPRPIRLSENGPLGLFECYSWRHVGKLRF